ncbi:MAG: fatty acid desaturase [Betaproteobacteria bacterium]|nr:MAG: fatty acid desaturase [Betaproteobacteria bacterium]
MPQAPRARDHAAEAASGRPADCQALPLEPSSTRETPVWFEQARQAVSDLYTRSAPIYWIDFTLTTAVAWAFAALYFLAPAWSLAQIAAYLASILLFFRTGTFMHELVHVRRGQMVWFGRAWNLFFGIPLLMPWIFYRNHADHHNAQHFGTPRDGEYLPLAASPLRETIKYLALAPLLPLFMLLRFGVLGPLSALHRGLREWVLTHASAAVVNIHYAKRFPPRDETHLVIVEALAFAYLTGLAALLAADMIGVEHILMGYLLLAGALGLNWIRTLAAHRYGNRGERMSHLEQMEDSINITGQTWLTTLLFPVGLRYHALHHLFPSLPYHNLGKAHRRLSALLPREAPYHATGRRSIFVALAELWRTAMHVPVERSAMRRWLGKPGLARTP